MLQLILSKSSTSTDCGTVIIIDSTPTGGSTGYGGSNPARNTLYMNFFATQKLSTENVTLIVPTYNYNTGASWSISITSDGWYEFYAFSCLLYSSGTTFQLNYITYDSGTNAFYKSLQNTNLNHAVSDPAWWQATNNIDDFVAAINASQPNVYSVNFDDIELCRSYKCEANMLAAVQGCGCSPQDCSMQDYEKVRMKIEGANNDYAASNFLGAQITIENISSICNNSDINGCGCA